MTQLIVARGQSPDAGPGAGLWTEGSNLVPNGDFETPILDLPFGAEWTAYNNDETVEQVTASPISGATSLHVVTTGVAATDEGCEVLMSAGLISSRQSIRVRFTFLGTGAIHVVMGMHTAAFGYTRLFVVWDDDIPATAETIERDIVVPDNANYGAANDVISFRPILRFLSYGTVADFTLDDVYLGILTPA